MLVSSRKYLPEEMYVDPVKGSIQKGRRIAPRTATCRPCLVWREKEPEKKFKCVIMDLNRYGLRVRSFENFDVNEEIVIQMMKEDFATLLGVPIKAKIVREAISPHGLKDYGAKRIIEEIRRPEEYKPVSLPTSKPVVRKKTKMHIIDILNKK